MSDKETARQQVAALVEKFAADHKRYTSPQYNETEVRIQFVNPLFEALGWDMADVSGRHEVFHEDYVEVEEEGRRRSKRPDYGFRLNNQTRFFVETKKPSVNLKGNPDPAFQVRRYGWSARLPVSILTDFEEFIVYDCRLQPSRDDAPTKGRLRYYSYTEYADKWDEIYDLFSYEAVRNNRLETWIQESKQRGTVTVDDAFLNEMEDWRKMLAQDIALHNPDLTRRQLNMAVQVTIDRIVFLRICEDRGIEPYGRLEGFKTGNNVYGNLTSLFRQADARYNSGLFHFSAEKGREEPDTVTLDLTLSDDTLQTIISRLYYPSPYAFAVIPADILGQIYERFLGKVIELVPGKGAQVEEKPEVRKAGGVYYTPTYIVDYIVQNTVGKLVDGKTPDEVAKLKILDPACGSGSFLIGAYQYLLDWHLAYYLAHEPAKHVRAKRLRIRPFITGMKREQAGEVGFLLTTAEKKRILLNNLYGVDLDQQAVEVTKLSLLLKVLEGETAATAQPELMAERVLPDLGDNIKWGNSLIGPDYYMGKQIPMFDEEELNRVRTFDWHSKDEGFGAIMAAGGFDAVIGNPPYIRIQTMTEWAAESVAFYKDRYIAASKGNYDIYVIFVEKALSLLNKNGCMGYILPHKFFNAQYGEPLRGLVAQGKHLSKIIHFGHQQIFANATTYTCLLFLRKSASNEFELIKVDDLDGWRSKQQAEVAFVSAGKANETEWNFTIGDKAILFDRLKDMPIKLGDTAHIFVGTQTSADDIFVLDKCRQEGDYVIGFSNSLDSEVKVESTCTRPFLRGKQIRKYETPRTESRLICPYNTKENEYHFLSQKEMERDYPLAFKYLQQNRERLEERENGKFRTDNWYAFGYPKSMTLFVKPKLIVPDYNNAASFTLDVEAHFYKTGYGIILKSDGLSPLYILGLLNSQLLFNFLLSIGTTLRGGYVRFWTQFIEQLPIRTINFDDPADKARHDRMVERVETMLDLHKQLAAAPSEASQKTIQSVIDSTDRQIDGLVYELYGLTDEEIKLVEGN